MTRPISGSFKAVYICFTYVIPNEFSAIEFQGLFEKVLKASCILFYVWFSVSVFVEWQGTWWKNCWTEAETDWADTAAEVSARRSRDLRLWGSKMLRSERYF